MNSIDFYQPPTKAGMPGNRRPTMSNLGVPTASGQGNSATALILNNEPSGRFQDYDLVEFLDMSAPEPKGFFNSFCEPAPELNGIEVDAKNTSYGLDITREHDRSGSDRDNDLPTAEELLRGARETQESQRPGSSNRSTSEKQDGNQDREPCSLSTPPTSMAGSEARCSTLHEKDEHSTSKTPPSGRKNFSSTNDTEVYKSSKKGRQAIGPDPSAGKDEGNQWDDKQVDSDGKKEEEEATNGVDKHQTPLIRSTKKRYLEKSRAKRRFRRRRFSSPLSSNGETEAGTESESDISSCAPFKPHLMSNPQPISSHSTALEGDISRDDIIKFADGRSDRCLPPRMAVIHEQQIWEGEIIKERDTKYGRGRPRKQYLVRWKPSWVDAARLTAPELLQNWKEKKALKSKR